MATHAREKTHINLKQAVRNFGYWCSKIVIPQKQWKRDPYTLGKRAIILKPLKIAQHQEELIQKVEETDFQQLVVVKSRQQGCTTIMALYMLWSVMYKPGYKCIFVIDHQDKAKEFRTLIENAYKSIPDELKVPLRFTHYDRIYNDEMNSSVVISTATINTARSETFTLGYVDELDFMPQPVQTAVMNGVMASCQKVVVACTPMFFGGRFYNLVTQAEADGRLYKKDFDDIAETGFYGSKENSEKWYKYLTEGKDYGDIQKEFHCSFSTTTGDRVCLIPDSAKVDFKNVPEGIIGVGIDIGWQDQTYVLFASMYKGKIYIFDELSFRHSNLQHICQTIKQKGYRLRWGAIDSQSKKVDLTSGISPFNFFQQQLQIPLQARKPKKNVGANTGATVVNNAFSSGQVFYDPKRVPLLERMFKNLVYKNGKVPHTTHLIDSFDALTYLLHNANLVEKRGRPKVRRMDLYRRRIRRY